MVSDSQIQSCSIFGRDRWTVTIGEDRECQNALVDSDEMQSASQPLDHTMITYGSHDAMGNLGAREQSIHLLSRKHIGRKGEIILKIRNQLNVIPWLSPDVQQQLLHHKRANKGFLKRSRQSMLNKTTGPKARTLKGSGDSHYYYVVFQNTYKGYMDMHQTNSFSLLLLISISETTDGIAASESAMYLTPQRKSSIG
ncbi:hypothetical protein Cgig2_031640 [Carnegiea gigantea]|uniref:Uncharacterized protein n=1 Tax=Carnegiea gigantea TaxID=171969 RepID=A0A9Q1QFJ2_9CARY|nr:hypothetical protein Cgig2_031640 [Carnegiea gigantea]